MTLMDHKLQCVALRQLETALRLYFERDDYYSVITLAHASEEIFGTFRRRQLKTALRGYCEQEDCSTLDGVLKEHLDQLLEKFDHNDKFCDKIPEAHRKGEDRATLQNKLRNKRFCEKKNLRNFEKRLKELKKNSREKYAHHLNNLIEIFNLNKPSSDSLIDAAAELAVCRGEPDATARKGVAKAATWVPNILKHGLIDETDVVDFDAEEIAKERLDRAISNYFALTGKITDAMKQFEKEGSSS